MEVPSEGYSKVNILNLITLRSITYGFPPPSQCGSSKLEAKLHFSPRYFFREPSRRSFPGRWVNSTTGRAVWSVTASNSTQETPGQPARFSFAAEFARTAPVGKYATFPPNRQHSAPQSAGDFRLEGATQLFLGCG